jgi:hypothetical protein
MISILEKREFSSEQLQIIDIASKDGLIVEIHSFFNKKRNREEYWKEQIKLPVNIIHTSTPILFKEYINKIESNK